MSFLKNQMAMTLLLTSAYFALDWLRETRTSYLHAVYMRSIVLLCHKEAAWGREKSKRNRSRELPELGSFTTSTL